MIYSLIENLIIGIFVDQDFPPFGHLQAPFSLSLKPLCLGQNVHVAFLGVGVESFQVRADVIHPVNLAWKGLLSQIENKA